MNDAEFRRLLDLFDLSWEGYRKVRKGVKKRLGRHIQALGLRCVEDYLAALDLDPRLKAECRLLLAVSISRFFRDRHLWPIIEGDILPLLARQEKIRVWSAGCACGEEAYSLKIVYDCLQNRLASAPPLEILATDLNPAYLKKARTGVYQRSSLKEVPEEFWPVYFEEMPGRKRYQVVEGLKADLLWREHDLLSGLSPGIFDLILMRNNVLTYGQEKHKEVALKTVAASLAEGGVLIIGSNETLPGGHPEFQASFRRSDIFQRQAGGKAG